MKSKLTKKSKRILNKLLGKHLCPHCKEDLRDCGSLGYSEQGEQIYELSWNGGNLDYEAEEFEQGYQPGEFFCRRCGESIPKMTEEEAIEILKEEH